MKHYKGYFNSIC